MTNVQRDQYNLKWNDFSNNLLESFRLNQFQNDYTDVSIYCGESCFKAHKIILSASSTIFERMFKEHGNQNPIIFCPQIDQYYMRYIIEFIYKGEIKVYEYDIEGVLSLGEMLKIKGLSSVKYKDDMFSAVAPPPPPPPPTFSNQNNLAQINNVKNIETNHVNAPLESQKNLAQQINSKNIENSNSNQKTATTSPIRGKNKLRIKIPRNLKSPKYQDPKNEDKEVKMQIGKTIDIKIEEKEIKMLPADQEVIEGMLALKNPVNIQHSHGITKTMDLAKENGVKDQVITDVNQAIKDDLNLKTLLAEAEKLTPRKRDLDTQPASQFIKEEIPASINAPHISTNNRQQHKEPEGIATPKTNTNSPPNTRHHTHCTGLTLKEEIYRETPTPKNQKSDKIKTVSVDKNKTVVIIADEDIKKQKSNSKIQTILLDKNKVQTTETFVNSLIAVGQNQVVGNGLDKESKRHIENGKPNKKETQNDVNNKVIPPKKRKMETLPDASTDIEDVAYRDLNGLSTYPQFDDQPDIEEIVIRDMVDEIAYAQQETVMQSLKEEKLCAKGAQGQKLVRSPNAFMIFANEYRNKLAVEYPSETNKSISIRLGNIWKSLPQEARAIYYHQARMADENHQKFTYPRYYYSPREARFKKPVNSTNKLEENSAISYPEIHIEDDDVIEVAETIVTAENN